MNSISARTAVVGVARSETPFTPGKSSLQLHAELAREAIADAGLSPADVDGVLTAGCDEPTYCEDVAHSAVLCEYMGLRPRFTYSVDLGTPVFAKFVEIAATAITSGLCQTVLIACAEPTVSRASRRGAVEKMASFGHPDFELPWGVSIPAFYALIARRHMHEFGTTPEQLAQVAVTMRRHAGLNPGARFREPISVDDVLTSRLIADPLHKLDCCITTDGGGAVVVTSVERARDLRRVPVLVLGTAQGFSHEHLVAAPSLTSFGDAPAMSMSRCSTTTSPFRWSFSSKTSTSARRARAAPSSKRRESGSAAGCRSTRTAACSRRATRAGPVESRTSSKPSFSFGAMQAKPQVEEARIAVVHGVGGIMSNHATAIFRRG